MRFKTQPMAHQLQAFNLLENREGFALLMEQGTGKTKPTIDDAARCWGEGIINALIVFAPNGVHTNWTQIEIPKHMPDWCPVISAYFSAGAPKYKKVQIEKLFDPPPQGSINPLRVLAINYEALATLEGKKLVERFTRAFNCMAVVDESQRIKNPTAVRTKEITKWRRYYPRRRILSGTPVTQSPFDVFSQFYFLDPTILRTESFVAFKSEYAEMLPPDHYLVKKIRQGDKWKKKDGTMKRMIPQVEARDADGHVIYKNLEKLNRLISKHSFRVLKKDCVDLPDKIYSSISFDLTPRQRQMYNEMERQKRAEIGEFINQVIRNGRAAGRTREQALQDGYQLIVQNKLSAMAKLQQITSGYFKLEDGEVVRMFKNVMDNPRNIALMESIEDTQGSIILWANHRDKIDQIIEILREGYPSEQIVRYDGLVSNKELRLQGMEDFQSGKARFFVGNPQSGGTGITLTKAETVYYYSNSFNLEDRLQSEDRAHRIGQDKHVNYKDLIALDTIDQMIVECNQLKKRIADQITGDVNL